MLLLLFLRSSHESSEERLVDASSVCLWTGAQVETAVAGHAPRVCALAYRGSSIGTCEFNPVCECTAFGWQTTRILYIFSPSLS